MRNIKVRNNLNECTLNELNAFISSCIRVESDKTGKLIKINTYKQSKSYLIDIIEAAKGTEKCLLYINGYYNDLPGYDISLIMG